MASDPTDAERDAAIAIMEEARLNNLNPHLSHMEAAFDALTAAGYRSPASLVRAWEMGRDAAAKIIKRRWEGYAEEHGFCDPTTGVTEYPGNGDEWVGDMQELEDEIRSLTPPAHEARM